MYVTDEGKKYQGLVRDALLVAGAWHRSENRLALRATVCPARAGQQDISNRIKTLEDALQNGNLFVNDSQIDSLEIRRGPIISGGCVKLSVFEIIPDYAANLRWAEC